MSLLRHFAPMRAIRDLRGFLAARERHELGFLALALVMTLLIIWGFVHDSHFEREYEREIIYVESWNANRTDAEIIAQQKIDQAEREKLIAEFEKREAERRASFKRLDDKLTAWGL